MIILVEEYLFVMSWSIVLEFLEVSFVIVLCAFIGRPQTNKSNWLPSLRLFMKGLLEEKS